VPDVDTRSLGVRRTQPASQCSHRITDVVAAWHDANPDQQGRLAAGILSQLHVKDGKINAIRPRPASIPYFEELLAFRWSRERETRVSRALPTQPTRVQFSHLLADVA
jgi:hypothetical protein